MSTYIELRSADFRAAGRPQLTPLDSGIAAAWNPYGSVQSLIDVSGNGHVLTKTGNPMFTGTGVKGDKANFYTSDLAETVNMAVLVIMRTLASTTGAAFSALPAGNFDFGPGVGLYLDTPAGASGAAYGDVYLKMAASAMPGTAGVISRLIENQPLSNMPASPWVGAAFNVTDTQMIGIFPKTGGINAVNAPMAARAITAGKLLKFLGASVDSAGTPGIEIAAVRVWQQATATADIVAEYNRIKTAFATSRPDITGL